MIPDCTAVILCGGESRRMGRDKATVLFRGKPLWRHVHEAVAPLFSEVIFSVRTPRGDLPGPQVADAWPGRGPMVGIASALQGARTRWVYATACDMPFTEVGVARLLAAHRDGSDVVVCQSDGWLQPLPGFYARSALPAMEDAMRRGCSGLVALVRRLRGCVLEGEAWTQSFADLDDPRMVAVAEEERRTQ